MTCITYILLLLQSTANLFRNIVKCLFSCTSWLIVWHTSIIPVLKLVYSLFLLLWTHKNTHTLRFVLLPQSDSRKGGINQLDMTLYPASNQKKSTCHYSLNIVTVNMLLQFNFSLLLEMQQRKLSPLKRANIIKVRCEFTVGQKLCSNETAVCVVWNSEVCSGQSFSP